MNPTNEDFLTILRAALRGGQAELERSAGQWQELFHLAEQHKVLPLIFEAVFPQVRRTDPDLAAAMKRRVRDQVILQTVRTEEFLALNRALRAAGVTPLVVKGIVCRNLYPKPDHRPSSDEDMLIPPEQFEACHRVMTQFGMHPAAEEPDAYEVPYCKEGSPLRIELHRHLFPPESGAYGELDRFFDGVFDRAVTEIIQGAAVCTMEYTDHLLYLICHAFKHFLHSGFGIRQVCDIVLYADRYGRRIDWETVLERCKTIRAHKFAAAIFQIGRRYLGFDPDAAAYPASWRAIRVDETALLEDILCAGAYGSSELSRQHSSAITLEAVTAQKQDKKSRSGAIVSAFPPARKLEGRYPYLKKHPWLLPAAWCSRLWTYLHETRRTRNNSAADALKLGAERVELLKQYGILKER